MKCHEENKNNLVKTKQHGWKHAIHMLICCGLPIAIIASLPWLARLNPTVAIVAGVVAPFICPILMGGMLFTMFRKRKNKKDCCSNETNGAIQPLEASNGENI